MYVVPCSKDLLNGCKVPMGLVVQPLAVIPREEVCYLLLSVVLPFICVAQVHR